MPRAEMKVVLLRYTPNPQETVAMGSKLCYASADLDTLQQRIETKDQSAFLARLMDMGQCNDAYSAIQIALALADAFQCGVNDLPLSLVLCWFEQKAVCILIALLALGIRNIRLGPTLPAFLSPGVVRVLQEKYNLMAVTTPEQDLKAILGEG